ncbi:MAG: hypothetical protein Tsb009_09580 [Planctomycetaceae bacterium]
MDTARFQLDRQHTHSRPIFWVVLVSLCAVFYLTEHALTSSLTDDFALTADELEAKASGGSLKRRVAFMGMALLGLLLMITPTKFRLRWGNGIGLCLLAFMGWAFLSITWSIDPSMTFRRWLVMSCLFIAACGLGKYLTSRELLKLGWMVPLICLMVGVAAEIRYGTFHPYSGEYRFSGTLHPNTQGLYLASLCIAAFCLCRESGWRKLSPMLLLALGFAFLVLTKSRTSTAGFLVAATLLSTQRTPSGWKWSAAFGGAWIVSVVALTILLSGLDIKDELTKFALMGRQEQAESLTGRLPIWTEMVRHIEQRPVTGYGYDSFWTGDRIDDVSTEMEWPIREAHSAYLDTLLSVGIVGLTILLTGVFLGLKTSSRQYLETGNPHAGYVFGMLTFGLLNGFTESGMAMPMFVPFLLVCGLTSLSRNKRVAGLSDQMRWTGLSSRLHTQSMEVLSR